MELLIPLIVIGVFSGLLLGLTGGGGSVIITPLLIFITVATISKSFIKKRLVSHQDIFVTVDNKHLIKMSGIALFTGIAIGFFSVGGGFLIIPALTFFTQLNQIMIRTTSLVSLIKK